MLPFGHPLLVEFSMRRLLGLRDPAVRKAKLKGLGDE